MSYQPFGIRTDEPISISDESNVPKWGIRERRNASPCSYTSSSEFEFVPVALTLTTPLESIPMSTSTSRAPSAQLLVIDNPLSSHGALSIVPHKRPASPITNAFEIVLDQTGKAFAIIKRSGTSHVLAVGERALNNVLRDMSHTAGCKLTKSSIDELNDDLRARAEMSGLVSQVWKRVACIPDGIEIDIGDSAHTRFRITPGQVTKHINDSETLFYRPQFSRPMILPAGKGDFKLLKKYLNLDWVSFFLFVGWVTYTTAHPKTPSSKYVILALLGGQGTGKSFMSKLVKTLIDPSSIGVQVLPSNIKDLSIAAQHSH